MHGHLRNRGKWAAIEKAIDDWGKTARLCLILVVIALCSIGVLAAVALVR
jgi:hypothetical protein